MTVRRKSAGLLVVATLVLGLWSASPAAASPGWGVGNYMWFKPGSLPTNGTLRTYTGNSQALYMTAGSGDGTGDECASFHGRLPNGWYNLKSPYYHSDNKTGTVAGRSWQLSDKQCYNGTIRNDLFIHTEQTSTNEQYCTSGDSPYCWDDSNDYKSVGCVKASYPNNGFPNSIGVLDSWWHSVGGTTGQYYSFILYVGSPSPPQIT